MGDFLTVLLGTSMAVSISFLLLLSIHRVFDGYSSWYYRLMKLLLMFYLVPVFMLVLVAVKIKTEGIPIPLEGEDFMHGYLELKLLTLSRMHRYSLLYINLCIVWVAGCVISLGLSIVWGHICIWKIRRNSSEVKDTELSLLFDSLLDDKKLIGKIKLFRCSWIISPFTSGILYPVIILPDIEFTMKEWEMLLRHELTHLKSRDVFYKQLMVLVRTVHWFNPLIWLFARELFETCEMACDENVIGDAKKEEKHFYAELLLMLLERTAESHENVMLAGFSDSERSLKRRLSNFMRRKNGSKKKKILLAILSAAIMVACPIVSYASATGVLRIQDKTAKIVFSNSQEERQADEHIEYTGNTVMEADDYYLIKLNSKGDNKIDITIQPGDRFWIDATLNSSSIYVSLTADSSSDSFRVGYTSESAMKYVSSTKGAINHTFSITPGEYSIYIENRSKNSIHVVGRITV